MKHAESSSEYAPTPARCNCDNLGHAARAIGTDGLTSYCRNQAIYKSQDVVQVNLAAESGEMGVLAQHVPSIEQLKPGIVEVIEESGSTKQFFRMSDPKCRECRTAAYKM